MEVKLTPLEYNLLAYFLEHPGWVVTREMVLNSVGGYDFCPNTRTVDAHVVRLRQKLEPAVPCMESAIVLCLKMKVSCFDGGREKDKRRIPRGFSRGARWALICGSR
jgi:hypothetical protein